MPSQRRYALVTGGGSGLGRAICQQLAKDGWHIAVADINAAAAQETLQLVQAGGGAGQVEMLDVRDEVAWADLIQRLRAAWPKLDLLVNNAGVCATGRMEDTSIDTWDWMQAINLRGVMLGCHYCVPWLKENPDWSYIMNMASVAGLVYGPHMGAYNAFKAAVVAMTETMWAELRADRVGVTAVCPWFVQTQLLENGRCSDSEKEYAQSQMRWTLVTPERVARKGLRATLRGKALCIVGNRAAALYAAKCWSAPIGRHIVAFVYKWTFRRTAALEAAAAEAAKAEAAKLEAAAGMVALATDQPLAESALHSFAARDEK